MPNTKYIQLVSGLPQSDMAETDATKPSYIKNKPTTLDGYGITDAAKAADVDDLKTRVSANETAINTLNSDATVAGSVQKQVADAVAKIVSDAPEAYDTLKEISDWISSHANDASAMNSQIIANQNDIAALETLIGTLPDTTEAQTIVSYIDEVLAGKVNSADIVDNLTSTDTDKPLSANQGKILSDTISQKKGKSGNGYDAEIFNDYTNNTASGSCAHAEGAETKANGECSHAEGFQTITTGLFSHAEGHTTQANGQCSHAEGYFTNANSFNSHSEGNHTVSSSNNQHVQGKYNIEDTENIYAHIVGNGTADEARSNAHTLDWSGNAWYAGKVSGGTIENPAPVENDNDYVTKKYFDENSGSGEVNQNAFSNVTVGGTTIAADSTTDTLDLQAGNNIVLTPVSDYKTIWIHSSNGVGFNETDAVKSIVFNTAISTEQMDAFLSQLTPIIATGASGQDDISALLETDAYQGLYCVHLDKFGGTGYCLAICDASGAGFTVLQIVYVSEYSETNQAIIQNFASSFTYTEGGWQNTSEFTFNSTIYKVARGNEQLGSQLGMFVGRDSNLWAILDKCSGGGGTTLNKYTYSLTSSPKKSDIVRMYNILTKAKGKVEAHQGQYYYTPYTINHIDNSTDTYTILFGNIYMYYNSAVTDNTSLKIKCKHYYSYNSYLESWNLEINTTKGTTADGFTFTKGSDVFLEIDYYNDVEITE